MSRKRPRISPFPTEDKIEAAGGLPDLFGSGREFVSNRERPTSGENNDSSPFFTLRLEHRSGEAVRSVARYPHEERMLLFRSDRAGPIAKIIYTPEKIHVLDVKPEYRGRDLGGMLFCLAAERMATLNPGVITLDAEEDVRRHNKLIGFYKQLGCQVKPTAKIQYINNNDGETYRKIPMTCQLTSSSPKQSLTGLKFLPIKIRQMSGDRANFASCFNQQRRLDWLCVDRGDGTIQFRTTIGRFLHIEGGSVKPSEMEATSFRLCKVSDNDYESDSEYEGTSSSGTAPGRKELYTLKSDNGFFLTIDSDTLGCSEEPSYWKADDLCLTCTTDTPPRRQHYRKMWIHQTVDFVEAMRKRYLQFDLARMTIKDALDLLASVPINPFRVAHSNSPSLRTLCFKTAEAARASGHPDWVQLIALLHELGSVVPRISELGQDWDWTITCRSRIVGCPPPDRASFAEFRHLNKDGQCELYKRREGMYDLPCSLDQVLLAWTGPEYMYEMLKHNNAMIPKEGLAMIRLFCLGDWHTYDEYSHFASEDEQDMKTLVADFDELRRTARRECRSDLTSAQCTQLWDEQYKSLAEKYGLDGVLRW